MAPSVDQTFDPSPEIAKSPRFPPSGPRSVRASRLGFRPFALARLDQTFGRHYASRSRDAALPDRPLHLRRAAVGAPPTPRGSASPRRGRGSSGASGSPRSSSSATTPRSRSAGSSAARTWCSSSSSTTPSRRSARVSASAARPTSAGRGSGSRSPTSTRSSSACAGLGRRSRSSEPRSVDGLRRVAFADPHVGCVVEVFEEGAATPGGIRPRFYDLVPAVVYVTLSVADLDEARRFYVDALGLEEEPETVLHHPRGRGRLGTRRGAARLVRRARRRRLPRGRAVRGTGTAPAAGRPPALRPGLHERRGRYSRRSRARRRPTSASSPAATPPTPLRRASPAARTSTTASAPRPSCSSRRASSTPASASRPSPRSAASRAGRSRPSAPPTVPSE